ncbi:YceI family protein [uncultured Thiodictyon sp.]|uniref:YceI family protein n=1 Tax=uncultured Thiodictyon sp. TaxID=1846217 RepID=UPI0025CEC58E|nr:YceI family protein [uncultured Thiodictyon sp.]
MNRSGLRPAIVAALVSAVAAAPAWADWTLDPTRSHLAFVSIKAKDVAEVHTFNEIKGRITPDGKADIALMLDSVETLVPIRNQRMREMLFDTADYKDALFTAKIDPERIKAMAVGEIADITAEGTLSLHGQTQPVTLVVQAAKVANNTLMVASVKPVVVDAAKFGMTEGVEKLREVAGLAAISNAVPVSFVLTFVDEGK